MKLLFDLLPVLLFFIAFKIPEDPKEGILLATGVAIIASFLQVFVYWLKTRSFEKMHLITLGMIVLLGGATLIFKNEQFIKWKPTAVNWVFAIVFLGSQYVGKKNLIQRMMGGKVSLPDTVWRRLNLSWSLFFIFLGALNLYVAYNYTTEAWVNFKLFGILGLTLLFVFIQAIYLTRHSLPIEENEN